LAFNAPSASLLGNPEEVMIGFDEERLTIGVKAADHEVNPPLKTYVFNSRMNHGWIRIGCKDFVKYLSSLSMTQFSPAKKYVARFDKESRILLVTIDILSEESE